MSLFQKATRIKKKLRLAITGVSGSGKTYTALSLATALGKKVALIDTEKGSSTLYAEYFDFDQADLGQYHPNKYVELITAAGDGGYDCIVVDSLSHAWYEMLNMVGGNFNAWSKVRNLERGLVDSLLSSPAHVIVTMRSKADYVDDVKNGKNAKVKVGTKAVMSDGIEYEFDLAGEMDLAHTLSISKSRCKPLQDTVWTNPGADLAGQLATWLSEGAQAVTVPVSGDNLVSLRRQTFKDTYTKLGLSRDVAIQILDDFAPEGKLPGATKPEDLNEGEFSRCLALMEEEASIRGAA